MVIISFDKPSCPPLQSNSVLKKHYICNFKELFHLCIGLLNSNPYISHNTQINFFFKLPDLLTLLMLKGQVVNDDGVVLISRWMLQV